MAEGQTYICCWQKKGKKYVLWLADEKSEIRWTDTDFGAAAEEVASQVSLWNGDGEAVLEFQPPRPVAGEESLQARLFGIGYNASARVVNRSAALFEGGLCPRCEFGIGPRTAESLEVETLQPGDVAGLDAILPSSLLLSDGLLGIFTEEERAGLLLQPVVSRSKKKMWELVGTSVASAVGLVGARYPEKFLQSWSCTECRREAFLVEHERFADTRVFLAGSDLPEPVPSLFVVDEGFRLSLAVTQARWRELIGQPGTKGISTTSIGVVPDALVEREPSLPQPQEFEWAW